jgi:hypothetical protein
MTPASSKQPRITSVTMQTRVMEHLFALHAQMAGRQGHRGAAVHEEAWRDCARRLSAARG